ncbi:MAG TPA: hypothetical protein VFF73_37280 [Planctomycetota bacterium]|nr:hypothetical protein [Planctomycetota bacterium]
MRLVVTLGLLLLAGCCSECDRPPPDRARPGDVVRELREAVAARRWDDAALCFSDDLRANIRSGSFEWPLEPDDTLLSVHLEDDKAIALVERKGGASRELVLERDRQEWRVASWRDLDSDRR